MASLTDQVRDRFEKTARRRTHVPGWMDLAQWVFLGAIVLALVVAYVLAGPGDPVPADDASSPFGNVSDIDPAGDPIGEPGDPVAPTTPSPTETTAPRTTEPAEDPAPPSSTPSEPDPAETVSIVDSIGGTTRVDAGSLEVARASVVALFTGDYAAVPLAPGAEVPAGLTAYPSPTVTDPVLEGAGDGTVTFSFVVEPDGDGPEGPRKVRTLVERADDGTFGWLAYPR